MALKTHDFVLKDDDDFSGVNPHGADCIRLRYIGRHKYEVIASMLQIPLGTVRSRINRAKAQILANRGNNATADAYKGAMEDSHA